MNRPVAATVLFAFLATTHAQEMELRAIGPNLRIEVESARQRPTVDFAAKARELDPRVRAGFEATARHLREKKLPAEIRARHEEAVRAYEERYADALQGKAPATPRPAPEPGALPWGAAKPATRKPYTNPAQFRTSRLFGGALMLAQAGSLSGISLPPDNLPAMPSAEDTAPTEDAPLSAAVRAQAQALGNHPVGIYNWVRNNIEFVPGYGSIQGADGVLRTRRGNAFDTASLLVALLRSANIAARYAYGTVEIPVAQATNWLGVQSAGAAADLLAQAGVPAALVPESGQPTALRLEHVWVEAFVDYVPSRGAVHRTPNTWVPLDASFKHFDALAGADLAGAIALNAQGVLDGARAGALCTPEQAQNVSGESLQLAYDAFKSRASGYLAGLGSELTVAGVLGSRRIGVLDHAVLLGTLPYRTVAVGSKFTAFPDSLRWKLRYLLYASEAERGSGNAVASHSASLPAHSGKRFTLSFVPASAEDRQVLDSYLPGEVPGYLVRVAAELRVDGALVSSGGSFVLGQELVATVGHFDPAAGAWSDSVHEPLAGEYHALAVDGQGVAAADLEAVRARLAATKAQLDAGNHAALTREDVAGDVLYQAALGYLALVDANHAIIARASGAADVRLPSYARAYARLESELALGIVMRVRFPGVALRADRLAFALAADNRNAYVEQSLARASAYAHVALERAFAAPGAGVSAMRALAAASAAGQPIYALTAANIGALIGQISLDDEAKADLANGVGAGLEALTQSAPLAFGGYTGGGYVLEDSQTAAAAYRLSSRAAGGASGILFPAGGMPWLALAQPAQAAGASPALAAAANTAAQSAGVLTELQGTASTRWAFFGAQEEVTSALFLARLAAAGAGDACVRVASLAATDLATTGGLPAPGTGANRAPVITSFPVTTAKAGQRYEYHVIATDPDGDALTYRAVDSPSGVGVSASGLVSWQEPLRGSFVITVRADDGRAYAEQRFMLTVADGAPPLEVSLALSPSVVDPGQTVTAFVAATGGVGSIARSLTVNGTPVEINAQGQAQILGAASGTYRVVLTATDSQKTVTREAVFTVRAAGDGTPPLAAITAPAEDAEITAPVNVVGTATDDNFAYYVLLLRPSGAPDNAWEEIGRGFQPVANGVLGRLDPTRLANGIYDLALQVVDVNQQSASRLITLDVYRDLKIGQFAITFEDLSVEASGIPIRVTRTYDTRRKDERLDFGFGWIVDYQSMTVRKNGVFGLNWSVTSSGFQLCLRPAGAKKINITLPTGKVERFTAANQPECAIAQVPQANTVFTGLAGTTSRLEVLNVPALLVQGGVLFDIDALDVWNPKEFKLTTEDGFVFFLSESSGITEIRDPFGNRLSYTANGIIHSNGQSVAFQRDPQGRITSIRDPNNKLIRYEYDARGDLVRVIDRLNQVSSFTYNRDHGLVDYTDPRGTIAARYVYDAEGRLVAAFDADGRAIEMTHDVANNREVVRDRRGNATTFVYDAAGNIAEKIDPLGNRTLATFDALGNEETTTDANEKTTRRVFDPLTGKLRSERDPLGNTVTNNYDPQDLSLLRSTINPRGFGTNYDYDGKNVKLITEPHGRTTSIAYDVSGNLRSLNIAGQSVTFGYDAKGNRTSQTDSLGNVTTYQFDANGNEIGRSWKRTVAGVQQTVASSRKVDENGRITEETDALGATTQATYNAAGKVTSTTDALGRRTTYEYDTQARPTRISYPDATSESIAYDAEGNEISRTDRAGRTTRSEYDALNRLTKVILPDGSQQETIYDKVGRVWKLKDGFGRETVNTYDDAGRLKEIRDRLGNVTKHDYDENGNRIRTTDAGGNVTDYEYDQLDRLIKTTFPAPVPGGVRPTATIAWRTDNNKERETDADGRVITYGYDAAARLTTVTTTVNGVSQVTRYTYDETGNRTALTDAENRQTKLEYDFADRPTRRVLPLGQAESHTYDAAGNRTAMTDFLGRITRFSHDQDDRVILKALPDGTRMTYGYTPSGQLAIVTVSGNVSGAGLQNGTMRYQYDANDRLVRQDNPDGSSLAYAYDANGNRTEISTASGTTRYQYDAANRLIAVIDVAGATTRYGYDAAGNRSVTSNPNNTRTVREYDVNNRVTQIAHVRLPDQSSAVPVLLAGYRYTLTSAGQKSRVDEYAAGAQVTISGSAGTGEAGGSDAATLTAAIAGTPARTVEWRYDETGKLTEEKVTEPLGGTPTVTRTTSYTYDKVGNRKTKTETAAAGPSAVTTYTYDANDRLTEEVRSSGASSVTVLYGWDATGNLASKTEGSLFTGYSYDPENRLVEVRQGPSAGSAQTIATYAYDAAGNRIAKTVNGQVTKYLVDANQAFAQVLEETASGGTKTLYTRGAGLISQSTQSHASYLYPDHLGGTRLIADAQGATTGTLTYEAFGQVTAQTGTVDTAFRFAGAYIDPETGFSYNRARYLALSTGRFISIDPAQGFVRDPTSLHDYLYASANPVNFLDPSGTTTLGEQMATMEGMGIAQSTMVNVALRRVFAKVGCEVGVAIASECVTYGIYILIDAATGGLYVGQSADIDRRIQQHIDEAVKYGKNLWKANAQVLARIPVPGGKAALDKMEQLVVDVLRKTGHTLFNKNNPIGKKGAQRSMYEAFKKVICKGV